MSFYKDYAETYRSNRSIWEMDTWPAEFDVVIIGAGFTGLYAALYIKRRMSQLNVMVMDKGGRTMGASSRNAGFVCFGSPTEILSDIETMGEGATVDLIRERYIGTQALKRLFDQEVDLKFNGGSEVFREGSDRPSVLQPNEVKLVNTIIESATGLRNCYQEFDPSQYGLKYMSGFLHTPYEGEVNPAKMLRTLTKRVEDLGVTVCHRVSYIEHEGINDTDLRIATSDGIILAKNLIFCTNALGRIENDKLDIRPGKNQVYVTNEIAHNLKGTYHLDEGYIYFRSVGRRILIGGGRHLKPDNNDALIFDEEIESYLLDLLRTHVQTNETIAFEHQWMGHIGIGAMKSPIVERTAKNVFIGLRMGGMGVALAPAVGYRLSDLLNESINV